jgi:hypothetical protein
MIFQLIEFIDVTVLVTGGTLFVTGPYPTRKMITLRVVSCVKWEYSINKHVMLWDQSASRQILLVKSKTRGKAVLHRTFEGPRDRIHSLVTLLPMALEIDHRDVTNRVTTSWVIVAFDTAGAVTFAGASQSVNQRVEQHSAWIEADFRLRQQYRFW